MGDLDVRKKWDVYQRAHARLLGTTSTKNTPWYVVPANSKTHRNLMIAQLLVKTLKDMKFSAPPADPALKRLVVR